MAETKARLGDLLVQEGFITDDQLIQALAEQKKSGKRLGQQLLDMGMVTESQMYSLLTKQKIRFGDLLVEEGYIDEDQLMAALEQQRQSGRKLGRQLIEMGAITEDTMTEMLARKVGIPKVDPNDYWVDQETAGHLPESQARRFRAMILEVREHNYLVAMADPTDLVAFDEINRLLDKPIEVVVAAESALLTLMGMVYRRTEEITHLAEELGEELGSENDIDLSTLAVDEDTASGPVVRVLQSIFDDAIKLGASDIHIEPNEKGLRIRTRKDGVLQEQILKQKNIHAAMVSLLKLMSNLDITERRLPQDGRFQLRVQKRSIDVRLSTLPLEYGEGIVMRLLDQSGGVTSLDRVGMPPRMLERFRKLIHTPNGIVLVTGPTGSGKSTTLYGALAELNTPEVKIITVEDPVEYRLDRINQVQVKEDIGLTFSSVLRTCLRQDPDIVMVGEMRDHETAEIGLRAAVTGHLVFSTLHTNDAVATINRLVDMGIEPFLLAASLRAVIAQRLLRRVCPRCREPYTPDEQEQ
ncbi:MAG: ATPase, T2SS/T4P/T4SS family, partial [Pseudomonadota bacterium]